MCVLLFIIKKLLPHSPMYFCSLMLEQQGGYLAFIGIGTGMLGYYPCKIKALWWQENPY